MNIKDITGNNQAAGVEITILPDSSMSINVVVLKKTKSLIVLDKQKSGISTFEELSNFIGVKQSFTVVINGKGIVHRKIVKEENTNTTTLLHKVLPNASESDFVVQQMLTTTIETIVSVIRTNVFEEILTKLKENGLTNIVACIIGPFSIKTILPLLKDEIINSGELAIDNYLIQLNGYEIRDLQFNSQSALAPVFVGENLVNSNSIVSFSAALSCFLKPAITAIDSSTLKQLILDYGEKKKFERRLYSILTISFLLLIVNYFIFNHYWLQNKELNSVLVNNQSSLQRYDTLKTILSQKKDFLERNGLLKTSRTSFFADQLASTLPSSIRWTELAIYPTQTKKKDEDNDNISFENNLIQIIGKCDKTTELNSWIKKLKKKEWIEGVSLLNYSLNGGNEEGQFLLQVKLRG